MFHGLLIILSAKSQFQMNWRVWEFVLYGHGHHRQTQRTARTRTNIQCEWTPSNAAAIYRLKLICSMLASLIFCSLSRWYHAIFNIEFHYIFQSEIVVSIDFILGLDLSHLHALLLSTLISQSVHSLFPLVERNQCLTFGTSVYQCRKQITQPIAQADFSLSLGGYGWLYIIILMTALENQFKAKKPLKILKHTTYIYHLCTYVCIYDLKRISCNLKCWRWLTQDFMNCLCGTLFHCYRKFLEWIDHVMLCKK